MESKQGSIFEAAAQLLEKIRGGETMSEDIKNWKNAASDIAKYRRANDSSKVVKLVRLKKDGEESASHDATKTFASEHEAQIVHDRMVKLNPNSTIKHNLYVDDKKIKTLG